MGYWKDNLGEWLLERKISLSTSIKYMSSLLQFCFQIHCS